ncbi:hypothetical protein DWB96_01980 [Staphylococcus caprae]|nr:hypothetical protein DWB96_01980 [Staphylococcus caprae]
MYKTHSHISSKTNTGPQHKGFPQETLQAMQVGVGAPTQRISSRNPTGNASWGPNNKGFLIRV